MSCLLNGVNPPLLWIWICPLPPPPAREAAASAPLALLEALAGAAEFALKAREAPWNAGDFSFTLLVDGEAFAVELP